MPLYDHECECGLIFESLSTIDKQTAQCPSCGASARRIITASGHYCANEDADWIRSVREVVGRDNPDPAARRFMKNPTRKNYKTWMKSEGIRPMDSGEKPRRPDRVDTGRLTDRVAAERMRRHQISVRE